MDVNVIERLHSLCDCQECTTCKAAIELESLRKDAERYRKLKTMKKAYVIGIVNNTSNLISHGGLSLDAAIDAAMGKIDLSDIDIVERLRGSAAILGNQPLSIYTEAADTIESLRQQLAQRAVERQHHEATFGVPECDYFECPNCGHQWGHE